MKNIKLDQKVQIQLNLYKESLPLFILVAIVFVLMLLTILRAPLISLDSLALELSSKL